MPTNTPWPEAEDVPAPKFIEVSEDPEKAALEILRGGVVQAAQVIVSTSSNSEGRTADRLRYDAAKEVMNRVLGKDPLGVGEGDPYQKMLDKINRERMERERKDADKG